MKRFLFWIVPILVVVAIIHLTEPYTHIEEKIMAIAKSTIDHIIKEEGSRNKAYKDTKGLWTIGVGHLIKPDEKHLINTVLTDQQVEELLRSDLKWCSEAVEGAVKVPLTQPQFDALYSFCFNIGETNFKKSTVLKRLNAQDYLGAADAMLMWNKPPEIYPRRKRERELFLSGL